MMFEQVEQESCGAMSFKPQSAGEAGVGEVECSSVPYCNAG